MPHSRFPVVVTETDAFSAAPRAFQLVADDTPDSLIAQIQIVEKDVAGSRNADPKDLILRLSPLVEGITRRIWANDFRSGADVSLASLLGDKLSNRSNSSPLEHRFARIARCLHLSYRNPMQHRFDDFHCSFDEARFFVAGVRALVDLWRQIESDRR